MLEVILHFPRITRTGKCLGGDMKRIFGILAVIALVFLLGAMSGYMDEAGVSLISESYPAISLGGRD